MLLNWVYENKDNYTDSLEVVEVIYADFNYPEIITDFVRYMPNNQPARSTLKENQRRLFENWKNFLENQKNKYSQ